MPERRIAETSEEPDAPAIHEFGNEQESNLKITENYV